MSGGSGAKGLRLEPAIVPGGATSSRSWTQAVETEAKAKLAQPRQKAADAMRAKPFEESPRGVSMT